MHNHTNKQIYKQTNKQILHKQANYPQKTFSKDFPKYNCYCNHTNSDDDISGYVAIFPSSAIFSPSNFFIPYFYLHFFEDLDLGIDLDCSLTVFIYLLKVEP